MIWSTISARRKLFVIAGPCVIESESLCLRIAEKLQTISAGLDIPFIFKASFDKANRSSSDSFRGPGIDAGLKILAKVRSSFGVPVLTDVHTEDQADAAAQVVDILQIPAFLCRQTDLIHAAVRTGKIVNIKKGQFLSPHDMEHVARKATAVGGQKILITERGTTFGYNNLVVDMRSIEIMRRCGFPVVFDATHSVQLPGAEGCRSGGQREFAPLLARSAVAAGADGVFFETHPDPDNALSDGPNMLPLGDVEHLLVTLLRVHWSVHSG